MTGPNHERPTIFREGAVLAASAPRLDGATEHVASKTGATR